MLNAMPTPNAPAPAAPANDVPQESPARKFFAVAQVRPSRVPRSVRSPQQAALTVFCVASK